MEKNQISRSRNKFERGKRHIPELHANRRKQEEEERKKCMHTRMRCLWSRGCMCTGGMFERVHVHTLRLYTGIVGFRELDRPSRY